MDYRISLIGLFIGFLIGLTGMGGGALLAPLLILVFRIPPVWAVGTDLAYSAVTKALGSYVHIRQKNVDFSVVFWLACGSVPATIGSVGLVQFLHKHYGPLINGIILHTLGFTLLLVAVLLITKPYILRFLDRKDREQEKQAALDAKLARSRRASRWQKRYRPAVTILIGAGVGFLVGLTSVGSGTLIIVALAFLFPKLSAKQLVGSDIVHALALLTVGTVFNMQAGTINWTIAGLLLIGSLPGVFLGSKMSKVIPEHYMRLVLGIVLAISGWKLI